MKFFTLIWIWSNLNFINRMDSEDVRIVHRRVKMPSPLGMTLFMSSFEDLLSLRTRAYLIKDVDPEILRRLLGARSLATDLDKSKISEYYMSKILNLPMRLAFLD